MIILVPLLVASVDVNGEIRIKYSKNGKCLNYLLNLCRGCKHQVIQQMMHLCVLDCSEWAVQEKQPCARCLVIM